MIRPIFIVGSPRSGTSVLTWSLGQHPDIYPLEETVWFGKFHGALAAAYRLGSSRGELSQLSGMGITRKAFYQAFGRAIHQLVLDHRSWPEGRVPSDVAFARARSPEDPKHRWVDGTPENSFHVHGIRELFPEAHFIHLLREVRPVVRSLRNFHRVGGPPHTATGAYDKWYRHVQACLQAERELGPEAMLRVPHRDLAAYPERTIRRCLEFLEEPFCEDCLLPLAHRINSSAPVGEPGADPEAGDSEEADAEVVQKAEDLNAALFSPSPVRG